MYVIKLGGSAITDKSKPFTIREEVIKRIPEEIEPALPDLVLVHGAGSYGHQVATKYALVEGFKDVNQLQVASYVKLKMQELTEYLHKILLDAGVPVFPFYPSSFMIYENGRPKKRNFEYVKGFFHVGLIPLIPPDGAFDTSKGFSIVSGDVTAELVAKEFKADALIFGVNVDGVLMDGEVVEELSPEEARELAVHIVSTDASGGMAGKLMAAASVAEEGIPVYIVNLLEPGRLRALLEGEKVVCTVIRKK